VVRDYQAAVNGNCTGVKFYGGCIIDSVHALDNYDRANAAGANNSNWLFYGTSNGGESFMIDCLSSGSSQGFKAKHAGLNSTIHVHRCVSFNDRNPFAMAQDRGSVRHSLFYRKASAGNSTDADGNYVFGFASTDGTTGGIKGNAQGMAADDCLIISDDTGSVGMFQVTHAFLTTPENPAYYNNLIVQNPTNAIASGFDTHRYATLPADWPAVFNDVEFITPNASNFVRMGSGTSFGLSRINEYGTGNTHGTTARRHERVLAGSTWVHEDGELTRNGVAV